MNYYILQTLALLVLSYFLGCWLGCFFRSIDTGKRRAAVAGDSVAATPAAVPVRPIEVARPATQQKTATPAPAPRPAPAPVRSAPPPPAAPAPTRSTTSVPATGAAVAAGAAATAALRPAPAPSAGSGDDLKRIKGIGPDIENRLMTMGVRRYTEIASWSASDVDRINRELGFTGRIQHENWIEQAQILAKGGETAFSRRFDRREVIGTPGQTWQTTIQPATPRVNLAAGQASARADTARIEENVAATAAAAAAAVAAAAAASREREAKANAVSGRAPTPQPAATAPVPPARPQMAATPQAAQTSPPTQPQAANSLPAGVSAAAAQVASQAAARAATTGAAVTSALTPRPAVPPAAPQPAGAPPAAPPPAQAAPVIDDLKRVRGITADIEKFLNQLGVRRFAQIAALTTSDVAKLNERLGKGRIERENWIEQAQVLARGGETEFSRRLRLSGHSEPVAAAAQRPAPGHGVQPQAQQPAAQRPTPAAPGPAAVATASGAAGAPARELDDLKRIKGIGLVIEKKLQEMGITRYEQIARLTPDDVARISAQLEFQGRIERENWIEQARILAKGG